MCCSQCRAFVHIPTALGSLQSGLRASACLAGCASVVLGYFSVPCKVPGCFTCPMQERQACCGIEALIALEELFSHLVSVISQ